MRYEDASHTGAFQGSEPEARNDADAIPAGSHVPATGNVITGEGTQTGPSGSDAAAGAHITSIAGAGGEDSSFAGGKLAVSGEFGRLSIDAEGNYSYQAKEGTPENSRDRFTYTLADSQGNADTATLTIEIGKTPAVIKANAQQVVPGPDGVVVLPAGVELSDIHIVGRNLVIDLPDGGQMVIVDGAVFVPQLVLGGVEVPATNLAALLIGQEIAPAEGGPPQSSGGNFEVPLPPLDPGVPLGDLIPPTEYGYQPPEVKEVFDLIDEEPEIFVQPDGQPASVAAVDSVDERGLPERGDFEPAGTGEIADGNGNNDSDHSEFTTGNIVYDSPDGVDSITISVGGNELVITNASVGDTINGQWGQLTITSVAPGVIGYEYRLADNTPGNDTHDDFLVTLVDTDGDVATATLRIDIIDDVPTARPDTDFIAAGDLGPVTGNVITDDDAGDHDNSGTDSDTDNGADTVGADDASLTNVTGAGSTQATEGGWIVQGQYGVLTINDDGSYSYLRNEDSPGGVSDVFTYTLTDGDGDVASSTLTITIEDATPELATPATAQLDDDVFTGGNPGGTDDANPDTANLSGNLGGSGGDGDLDYAFTGTNNLPAGFTVDPSSTATELKIAQNGNVVLTITLNTETGAYTVVQNAPIDHPTPGVSEEDLTFGIGVKTVDVDGDSAVSTLTINVDDDTPLAFNDSDTIAGGGTSATGNVITGSGTNEGTGNADKPGADGLDTITAVSGSGGSDTDATGGFSVSGTYGSLQMAADGSYTYTRNAGSAGGVSDVFTYTYRDGDGDLASATLTINIEDAVPQLGTPAAAQLDDETFTGGNPGGTGDVNPDTANLSGSLAGSGGDGDLDYAFTGTNTLPAGFSASVNPAGTVMQISQAGVGVVLTVTLDLETGAYTVVQNQPMDHVAGLNENDLTFGIGVKVVDVDGDSAVNTLTINVDDDTPLAFNDTDTVSAGTATGNVITGVGTTEGAANADKPGADGFDTITSLSGSGGSDSDPSGGFTAAGSYGTLQMAADGSYTYTRNDGLGGGQSEVFTYTYRDGDGDLASATLTITIPDAAPLLGTPAPAQLDDDALTGGNPGGTGDVNPDTANLSGNLAGSGGDGDLDYAFTGTNALPAGFSASVNPAGTIMQISQAGVGVVLTVTLDVETGAYTVTQNLPMDHPAGLNENDLTFGIGVKVVDVDGDSAVNTLTINVDDDTPLAFNDTDTIPGGGNSATGNVITGVGTVEGAANADKPGADGFDTITGLSSNGTGNTDTDASGGFTSVGTYGTLQMAADGSYTYTRAGGGAGNVSESFVYTYRDGDGDLASATLTINIQDAAPLLGTPAPAQLDDDALAGGNPGGTGDVNPDTANLTGNLAGSGGDGDLDYAFTGTNTLPAGFSVDPSSTASTLYIAQAGVGIVMTVTLDLETGAYTVTQNLPMDHPAGLNENDLTFGIGVKVVDVDGDSAVNTLTINVDDDTPLAFNDTDAVSAGTATGNVITGVGTTEGAANADKPGADGFDTITSLSGSGGSDSDPSGGFTAPGTYGTLQMAADGSYTYTRAAGSAGGVSESFTYTYRDGDGDLASATLTISIPDAAPTLPAPAAAQLDDETFTGGNPGGTGDVSPNTANLSGSLAGTGGDGDLDYAFTNVNTLPAGFSVDGTSTATTLYIAQAGVGIVMTVTLDPETGAYTVTQNLPMDHPAGSDENDLTFGIGVKVIDVDGDSATSTLTINVDDDTPINFTPVDLTDTTNATASTLDDALVNDGTANATRFINDSNANPANGENFIGADGFGSLTFTSTGHTNGEQLENAGGDPLTSGGDPIYVFGYGTGTLTATTSATNSDPGAVVFTVNLNANAGYGSNSTYTIDFNQTIDNGSGVSFDNLTSTKAGNVDVRGVGANDAGTTVDLLLTASANGSNATINTSSETVGAANQSMNSGETVRIDFVTNLQDDPNDDLATYPSGFTYDGHITGTQSFTQLIPQVGANQSQTVAFRVYALNTTVTDAGSPDDTPVAGLTPFSDSTTVAITTVTIDGYNDGPDDGTPNEPSVTVALGPVGTWTTIAYGVSAQLQSDGSVIFSGVQQGDEYGIGTGSNFNAVAVTSLASGIGPVGNGSTADSFDLGVFAIGQVDNGDPINLAFDVTATDGDGDTSTGTIDVTLAPDTSNSLLAPQSTMLASSEPANDDISSFSSLLASDSQLQKTAANSNNTLLAAAVAASGLAGTQAAASPGNSDFGHQMAGENSNFASKFASLAVDSGDESRSMLSSETKVAANDEMQTLSSSHGHTESAQSAHGLDNAAAHMPAELSAFFAGFDQGPAVDAAAAGPVAPAIAMVSAEALQAAGLDGTAKHGGAVDKVVADALGHEAPPTVDGLLQALGGHGGGELAAISHVASPAADTVPAWDMGGHGAFVPGADMMFKMGAEMLHHDAVQPVVNG